MTKHIFSPISAAPSRTRPALIGCFAGAEKGLFKCFVFVERGQRARTGSQQRAAERQRLKWGAVCQINPPCPRLLRPHQQPLLQIRRPESLQQRREASRYTKVPVCALQADTCTPTTESRSTRPAIPRIHICACRRRADSLCKQKQKYVCVYCTLLSGQSFMPVCGGNQVLHLKTR